MRILRFLKLSTLVVALAACADDVLDVENPNNPDRNRVLRNPSDVEGLASSQYQQILSATIGAIARVNTGMMTASFENASTLANNGLGPRSGLPRQPIDNNRGNAYTTENYNDFRLLSSVARNSADILVRAKDPEFSLGAGREGDVTRLISWAYFTYATSLGYLSLVYDSAGIPRTTDDESTTPPLESYQAVNAFALEQYDSALAYASKAGITALPPGWLTGPGGVTVSPQRLTQVTRSFKAKMRAGVARNATERAAVNWASVIADATNGIVEDIVVRMDQSQGWDYAWLATTLHFRDSNWHQMTYYIIGMADVSGSFEAWLATHRDQRTPFTIITPDLRFPQGATRAEQVAVGQGAPTGRRYFRNRDPGGDQASTGWQVSQYDHYRFRAFSDAGRVGNFPIFTKAENDMLAAEGYIRTGNINAAAALIDLTRTTAGLPALSGVVTTATQPVPGGASCVPRVPVAPTFTTVACGTIMEAMKWEKRIETAFTTYGAWFFDSRGWGDLPEGTPVHWPVPNQEADARVIPIYNLGGIGQPGAAAASSYGYGGGATR